MTFEVLIANFKDIVTKHYFDFNGRASRRTYWYFVLVEALLMLVALGLSVAIGFLGLAVYGLLVLALFFPSLGLGVRRLHDTDRSGWWILLGAVPSVGRIGLGVVGSLVGLMAIIVLIVWYATPGTPGSNRYGPDPKVGIEPEIFS